MNDRKLLTEIMRSYVGANEKMPIHASEPVVRTGARWELTDEKILRKTYTFSSLEERNAFLYTHLQQDGMHGVRHCRSTVDGMNVKVELGTDGGLLLDLDKERAKMLDALWRDVVYSIGGRQF